MRLLYGVVGDGMGHATRSRVVIEHLLARGHEVHALASDRAFGFLAKAFEGRARFEATEIAGLKMVYRDNAVRKGATAAVTLRDLGLHPGYLVLRAAVRAHQMVASRPEDQVCAARAAREMARRPGLREGRRAGRHGV